MGHRLNISGFEQTLRRLHVIHDLCSEATFDPATPAERRAEVEAFRTWLIGHRFDQSYPNGWLHDEASRRAYKLFGDRDLLIGVDPEEASPLEAV